MKMNSSKWQHVEKSHNQAKMLGGLFVIAFGVLILLRQLNFPIHHALVSWQMVLMLIGTVMLVKHRFKKFGAYVLLAIGGVFMLRDFFPFVIETRFLWPVLIILFGISLFFKAFRSQKKNKHVELLTKKPNGDEDFFESTAFFGGVNKNIVSKNFKGASVYNYFGGTELNLLNADFDKEATIVMSCVFGGLSLTIPQNWKVVSEVSSVFGGIDDKRNPTSLDDENQKILYLKGSCVFGGVEITSYV
jgi:predicted membrane protein